MSRGEVDAIFPRFVVAPVAAALIAVAGCTGRQETATAHLPPSAAPQPSKIGLMTGTALQGGEEFRAAKEIARRYARRVMHITFPDDFPRESVTVVAQLAGLAGEPRVKSIVVGQAIPGSVAAARKIRAIRPDMMIGFVTPREDPDSVAAVCDLAIGPDELARAPRIVAAARRMGATSFVYYSFPRHLSQRLLVQQRDLLREECGRRGVRFCPVIAPDPAAENGSAAARDFAIQDVPRQLRRLGRETAFYATSDAMLEGLIHAMLEARAGYLVEPALPAPGLGGPAALGMGPMGEATDPSDSVQAFRRRIAALGMSGHFGTWTASLEGVAMKAMASLMIEALERRADPHDSATVRRFLEAEARGPVAMRRFRPGVNQWMILLERVTY